MPVRWMGSAGHGLLGVYAVRRPDEEWSLVVVNRDQENAHTVRVTFEDAEGGSAGFFSGPVTMVTFGREQYQWHSDGRNSHADPDQPPHKMMLSGGATAQFTLPNASLTVLRGKVSGIRKNLAGPPRL